MITFQFTIDILSKYIIQINIIENKKQNDEMTSQNIPALFGLGFDIVKVDVVSAIEADDIC